MIKHLRAGKKAAVVAQRFGDGDAAISDDQKEKENEKERAVMHRQQNQNEVMKAHTGRRKGKAQHCGKDCHFSPNCAQQAWLLCLLLKAQKMTHPC